MIDRQLRSVDVTHLIGTPWREQHCGALAFRVLHDVIGIDVREHDLWLDTEAEDLDRRVEEYLKGQGDRWELVGKNVECGLLVGDVLWSYGEESHGHNHLSVVIALDPIPKIVSTSRRANAFIQRASCVRGLLGIYRFIG